MLCEFHLNLKQCQWVTMHSGQMGIWETGGKRESRELAAECTGDVEGDGATGVLVWSRGPQGMGAREPWQHGFAGVLGGLGVQYLGVGLTHTHTHTHSHQYLSERDFEKCQGPWFLQLLLSECPDQWMPWSWGWGWVGTRECGIVGLCSWDSQEHSWRDNSWQATTPRALQRQLTETYCQSFSDKGVFAGPGILAWGADFWLDTNPVAQGSTLRGQRPAGAISVPPLCLPPPHGHLPERSLHSCLESWVLWLLPRGTALRGLALVTRGLMLSLKDAYILSLWKLLPEGLASN